MLPTSVYTAAEVFLLTPLREGRLEGAVCFARLGNFYSRPCGRGDSEPNYHVGDILTFLLTPLREGRRQRFLEEVDDGVISTHAPAGGATVNNVFLINFDTVFLLTPLREGRREVEL